MTGVTPSIALRGGARKVSESAGSTWTVTTGRRGTSGAVSPPGAVVAASLTTRAVFAPAAAIASHRARASHKSPRSARCAARATVARACIPRHAQRAPARQGIRKLACGTRGAHCPSFARCEGTCGAATAACGARCQTISEQHEGRAAYCGGAEAPSRAQQAARRTGSRCILSWRATRTVNRAPCRRVVAASRARLAWRRRGCYCRVRRKLGSRASIRGLRDRNRRQQRRGQPALCRCAQQEQRGAQQAIRCPSSEAHLARMQQQKRSWCIEAIESNFAVSSRV